MKTRKMMRGRGRRSKEVRKRRGETTSQGGRKGRKGMRRMGHGREMREKRKRREEKG